MFLFIIETGYTHRQTILDEYLIDIECCSMRPTFSKPEGNRASIATYGCIAYGILNNPTC